MLKFLFFFTNKNVILIRIGSYAVRKNIYIFYFSFKVMFGKTIYCQNRFNDVFAKHVFKPKFLLSKQLQTKQSLKYLNWFWFDQVDLKTLVRPWTEQKKLRFPPKTKPNKDLNRNKSKLKQHKKCKIF
jgi:hypothetical protein